MARRFDQAVTQGDTWARTVRKYNPLSNGTPDYSSPVDWTGWSAKLQVRKSAGTDPVLTLTSEPGGGITITEGTGPDGGTITWRATPTQMAAIPGNWRYQLETFLLDGATVVDRDTLLTGLLLVEPEISA